MVDTGRAQNTVIGENSPSSLLPLPRPPRLRHSLIVIPSFTRPRYMICAADHYTLYGAPLDLDANVSDLAGYFCRVTTRCYLYNHRLPYNSGTFFAGKLRPA